MTIVRYVCLVGVTISALILGGVLVTGILKWAYLPLGTFAIFAMVPFAIHHYLTGEPQTIAPSTGRGELSVPSTRFERATSSSGGKRSIH